MGGERERKRALVCAREQVHKTRLSININCSDSERKVLGNFFLLYSISIFFKYSKMRMLV